MNKNAQSWLKALRSNEYVQTTGFLHRTTTTPFSKIGWCCLGVACDVYQKKVGDLTITQKNLMVRITCCLKKYKHGLVYELLLDGPVHSLCLR